MSEEGRERLALEEIEDNTPVNVFSEDSFEDSARLLDGEMLDPVKTDDGLNQAEIPLV